MNKEFHFYITYILSKRAGFNNEDSYIIAYSSQYVDDNTTVFIINKGNSDEYQNYISQTINILKPRKRLMRIYPCFHFVPGEYDNVTARRKDGKLHILNTTPDSSNAGRLMDLALSSDNPYRIGIATHCFADSWAHQNFVGYFDGFNGMGGLLENITPNIGHADAQHSPDIPGLIWPDERLISSNKEVHNTERFLDAAENIFKRYKNHIYKKSKSNKINKEWKKLKNKLESTIGKEFHDKDKEQKKRISRYKQLLDDFIDYNENTWFKEAVKRKVVGLPDKNKFNILNNLKIFPIFPDKYYKKDSFEDSHWYKFQEAVKEHQNEAEELYADIFEQMEVEEY